MSALSASADRKPVAVVGIGCRYPGGVIDSPSFWRLLSNGGEAITEIPADRIDLGHFFDARPATAGRIMTRWGGFLDGIEDFDASFFGISPREAERLDPAQRLVLETAWEGLEDAGIDATRLDGSATGVFVGQWLSDFEGRLFADPEAVDFYMTTGSGRYCTSGRLSYLLGLRGPSLTVDTACSSSLVAIHLAVRSLRSGECTLALAGGVNIILQPHISVAYSQSRMMAPDGRCKFGDASGDGYVRSEGAGLVVLKPLEKAQADGDRIYAVIRGSAVNNDGRSSGSMGTPSRAGQEALLRTALGDAGVAPGEVGYVEAHGTGTRAGDPVELGALGAVLGEGRSGGARTRVGSVKTNLGHTEGAAGVAGLIKVALALHHERIPQSLNCRELNPAVDWAGAPLEIARESTSWSGNARVGGVSAFGIAGTNAHVVLESVPAATTIHAAVPRVQVTRPALLALSARSPEALRQLARRYAGRLSGADRATLDALCWNVVTRRAALECRAVFVADNASGMVDQLTAYGAGEAAIAEGTVHAAAKVRPVFVVPGQGGQWIGMARSLIEREPVFREALQACDAAARPYIDDSLLAQLALDAGQAGFRLDRIELIQPALVAVAIAYARWLASLGIEPGAVVGHSMGEVGAAHLAGVLDLDAAMHIICRRSALMGRTSGRGAMAMVDLSMAEAEKRLAGREVHLAVAVSNSPRSCVVSGDPSALHALLAELEADGVFCRLVKVDVASHSPQMDEAAAALTTELTGLAPQAANVPIHSTVLARRAEGAEFDAAYWGRNMRQPVRFGACIEQLVDAGANCFIELGPHPVLTAAIAQTAQLRGANAVTLVCGRRAEPEQAHALGVVAGLWCAGHAVHWARLMPPAAPVDLPLYPWQRERHWVREAAPVDARRRAGAKPVAIAAEQQAWLHALRWLPAEPMPATRPPNAGAWIVVSDCSEDAQPLLDALAAAGARASWAASGALADALRRAGDGRQLHGVVTLVAERDDAPYGPVATMQALARAFGADAGGTLPKLWWATTGAQVLDGHCQARVAVRSGACWGAARVIAEEHPEAWGGIVDLDPTEAPSGNAALLAQELLGAAGESQVAWRAGERFVLRLRPLSADAVEAAPLAWRADAAYLVTGGLGELGLRVARAMVAQGARRLVLMGRHGLPARRRWNDAGHDARTAGRIAAVRGLEAAGASVQVLVADTADAAQVEATLRSYTDEAWPPIRGVVHAAGITDNHLALQTDPQAFERVLAPKLHGALHLDRLLPELDCFILFSSISALLGAPGMANYAAANAGLDALAADRRARGLPALSLQWGPWEGTGLFAGEAARQNMDELRRQGVQGFTPEQGVALFAALTGRGEASITVMPVDWATLASARRGRDLRLYSGRGPIGAASDSTQGSLADRLAAASSSERRKLLEPVVREAVGQVLKLAPTRIDPKKPLGTMGLSSLLALELRNRLEAALGRPLSATLAWNYPTVEALVGFLGGDAAPVAAPASVASPVPAAETIGAVAQLSDAEAAQLLRRKW